MLHHILVDKQIRPERKMKVRELFESDIEVHCRECGEYKECNADDICKSCEEAMHKNGMNEAWANAAKVKHTGQNTNKSIAELEKEKSNAKKSGNTKAVKQKNFAIRAKKAHGGKWAGVKG